MYTTEQHGSMVPGQSQYVLMQARLFIWAPKLLGHQTDAARQIVSGFCRAGGMLVRQYHFVFS